MLLGQMAVIPCRFGQHRAQIDQQRVDFLSIQHGRLDQQRAARRGRQGWIVLQLCLEFLGRNRCREIPG
jgi:hypothetical protein